MTREEQLDDIRQRTARNLEFHKGRIDRGLHPVRGLRVMAESSASVIADIDFWRLGHPFAQFSLDSRDPEVYATAQAAARDLVAYWRTHPVWGPK